jgi:hypothetical protein
MYDRQLRVSSLGLPLASGPDPLCGQLVATSCTQRWSHTRPTDAGEWGSLAVTSGERPTTLTRMYFLVSARWVGALGRIRTCAHGSGGRCSIP